MKRRVLVVDDEPDFLELITYALETHGFECSVASDGMKGLEEARRLRPDIVVLDVMLPDLDGFTVCEMLRRHPATSGIVVLMTTCLGGTLSRMNGFESGADDYLTKPFPAAKLIDHIQIALRNRSCPLSA